MAGFKLILLPSCEILLLFEFLRRDNTVISWSLPPAGTADMSGDHCFLAQVIKFTLSVVSSVVLSVYKSKMAPSDPIPRRWEFVYKTVTRDGCVQGRSGKPLLWLDCNGHGKHCTSPSWPGAGRSFWACLFPISSTMSSLRNHQWTRIHWHPCSNLILIAHVSRWLWISRRQLMPGTLILGHSRLNHNSSH